jgi:hypothetical protein
MGGSLVRLFLALAMTFAMLAWGPTFASKVGPALAELITRDLISRGCGESSATATQGRQIETKKRDGRGSKREARQSGKRPGATAANDEQPRGDTAC